MVASQEQAPELIARSFDAYTQLLSELNLDNPQHQGFFAEEFERALQNPSVITTSLEVDGEVVKIPQLAPIQVFEWLNDGFYEKVFPEEFKTGNLMHFTDIPGVTPGEEVLEGIKSLAEAGGTLVFDTPSSDPEYLVRVDAMLAELGIGQGEKQQLGTQTYYAGPTGLKREHVKRDEPIDMLTAYREQLDKGVYPPLDPLPEGASLLTKIDDEEAERLRQLYDDAYVVLNDHPCKQGLDADEFRDMLVNDDEVGKLVFVQEGQIVTLCLLTNDLDKLSWVNPQYYQQNFPEQYDKKQLVWFPGIATDPDKQGERNSGKLIALMAELTEYGDNEIVGLFDFCDLNASFLDQVFDDDINATPQASVDIQPIAKQTYYAVKLEKAAE